MSQKPIHRIFTLGSMGLFFGSMVFSTFKLYSSAFNQPRVDAATTAKAKESQLEANELGYERVLKQEPENQVALRGLVDTRLQMNDAKSAKKPLEKLVKLNPDQKEYKKQLTQVKERVGDL